jgi:hypothetical protein
MNTTLPVKAVGFEGEKQRMGSEMNKNAGNGTSLLGTTMLRTAWHGLN